MSSLHFSFKPKARLLEGESQPAAT